jgi:hypothetical protein
MEAGAAEMAEMNVWEAQAGGEGAEEEVRIRLLGSQTRAGRELGWNVLREKSTSAVTC